MFAFKDSSDEEEVVNDKKDQEIPKSEAQKQLNNETEEFNCGKEKFDESPTNTDSKAFFKI